MSRYPRALCRSRVLLAVLFIALLGTLAPSSFSAESQPSVAVGDPNLLIILDSSASMSRNDPDSLRILAAQIVLALAGPRENVAVVAFSSKAQALVPLQSVEYPGSRRAMRVDVDALRPGGFTNYSAALDLAEEILKANPSAPTGIIFLSDGRNNRGGSAKDVLNLLKKSSLNTLHTVAFKDTAETDLLRDMAVATGGTYSLAREPAQLLDSFQAVARTFWPYAWVEGRNTATIFPSAKKIAFVAEHPGSERAILDVTLNDQPLPPDLAEKVYVYPPPDVPRRWPIEIWTLDNPPPGRYVARLSPGAKILSLLQRLPFSVDFVPDKPKPRYQETRDNSIDVAVKVSGPDPALIASLQKSVVASVTLTDSSPISLKPGPVASDASGASFLLAAVEHHIDYPTAQREKAVDVLVTLKLKDPSAASASPVVWTKELGKTIVLRRLPTGVVTVGSPDVRRPQLRVTPDVLDFGAIEPPYLPATILVELSNSTSETVDLTFRSAASAPASAPAPFAFHVSVPALGDQETTTLSVPPRRTLLIRVGISYPPNLPDGDYDDALLFTWTPSDGFERVLEVPATLSVKRAP